MQGLNQRAFELCNQIADQADLLRVSVTVNEIGSRIIDCGVESAGGLDVGIRLAEVCLAGLGQVQLTYDAHDSWPAVVVSTDHPVDACMASQYAGWQLITENYFAMGSGPFRAAAGREELFDSIGRRETPIEHAVGVLEASQVPPPELCVDIAAACQVSPDQLTLLVARTASHAGNLQVVARSVETALHKMHELGFDLEKVSHGIGTCPLPPISADDLTGIGRTNDAVLYGAQVTLWVAAADEEIRELGPQIPSCSSSDHGAPFSEIFERYGKDFYRIDPHLFSPARITLINIRSGNCFRFGELRLDLARKSFLA